jgi:arylformamidase
VFDISVPIEPAMAVWPGDPPPVQTWLARLRRGDAFDLSAWTLGSHTGTHVDAPSHFVPGGADVAALDPRLFVGPCQVLAPPLHGGQITAATLQTIAGWRGTERVLLKTRRDASTAPAGLTPDAAALVAEAGVRLVGIDQLSIESAASVEAGAPVHQHLLGHGVVILEGLDLRAVTPGGYWLIALPLRLQDGEASPVRAVLFRDSSGLAGRVSGTRP